MRPDERRERVGHRSTEPDRTYRVSGMSQARFAMSMAPRLARCVGSLLYGCLRPAGAAARKGGRPASSAARTVSNPAGPLDSRVRWWWQLLYDSPVHCRHAVAGCKAAERQINAAHGRKLVAPAPVQLRWKSMLVNHVKYDATRVTGTVSGTSRQ
eukprot:scaffold91122_cov64-Phaeocystis_antarctica.AAC.3